VATPISITEKKEEPAPAIEATPAVPANEASPAEQASPETPKPEEQKPAEPQKEIPVKVPTWQEVLKQQPDTNLILKELGYDDKAVKLLSKLKQFDPKVMGLVDAYTEGKHVDYLKELTTDYSKMSAEEVMRHQLQQEYQGASKQQLDALFKHEVTKAYSLDSEDEDERTEGKFLLEAKADKHRATLIANQQNYLLPTPPEPKAIEPDLKVQAAQKEFENYKSYITDGNSYSKNVFSTKQIAIGEGDEKFIFPVEPADLMDIVFDSEKGANALFEEKTNADGTKSFTPNVEKHWLAGAVMKYGKSFLDAYAQHWKSLGGKSAIKPIDNAKEPDVSNPSASEVAPTSAAEAMAKQGQLNSGGYNR
jgi:hypothetical protein